MIYYIFNTLFSANLSPLHSSFNNAKIHSLCKSSTLAEMFGDAAVKTSKSIGDNISIEVFNKDVSFYSALINYFFFLALTAYVCIILYKYSAYFDRVVKGAFSVSVVERMIQSSNYNLNTMTFLLRQVYPVLLVMMVFEQFNLHKYLPYESEILSVIIACGVGVLIMIYQQIIQLLFLINQKTRRAFKRIIFTEQFFNAYVSLLLFPFLLFACVDSPFVDYLNIFIIILIFILIIRYIIISIRLFFTENISYLQLILYLCISNGIIVTLIILMILSLIYNDNLIYYVKPILFKM